MNEPIITCLGVAFKANVDDCRQSPALYIIEQLVELKIGEIIVCDPHVIKPSLDMNANEKVLFLPAEDAIKRADMVVLLVDHDDFKKIDISMLQDKIIIDTRGFFNLSN